MPLVEKCSRFDEIRFLMDFHKIMSIDLKGFKHETDNDGFGFLPKVEIVLIQGFR